MSAGHPLLVLPDAMRQGLTGLMICSGISCFATSTLLIYLSYQAIKGYHQGHVSSKTSPQGFFWLVNLFVADFIQSFSSLLVTRFITTNSVFPGSYCTVQAIGLIAGDVGSALWTLVITLHTFLLLAGGTKWRSWVAKKSTSGKGRWVFCAGMWIFILLNGLFGLIFIEPFNPKSPYYDQAGAGWCYIGEDYFWERIVFTYAFLFLNMATLTVLYSILFCFIRIQSKSLLKATYGSSKSQSTSHDHSSTNELRSWEANLENGNCNGRLSTSQTLTTCTVTVSTHEHPVQKVHTDSSGQQAHRRMNKVSTILLLYPVLYIILTMPLAVSRIAEFAGQEWGLTYVYIGASIFDCSGLANVLLYTTTRKGIISWSCFKRRHQEPTPLQLRPYSIQLQIPSRSMMVSSEFRASSIASLNNSVDHPESTDHSDSESEQHL